MPTLHFSDGTSKNVEYDKTTSVRKILDDDLGDWKPTPEQIAYAATVADISYEDLPSAKRREQLVIREHDNVMDEIYKSGLKGRDLFKAVCERIKARNAHN